MAILTFISDTEFLFSTKTPAIPEKDVTKVVTLRQLNSDLELINNNITNLTNQIPLIENEIALLEVKKTETEKLITDANALIVLNKSDNE